MFGIKEARFGLACFFADCSFKDSGKLSKFLMVHHCRCMQYRCRWYWPVVIHNFAGVVDTSNASFAGINDTGDACIAGSFTPVMHHQNFESSPVSLTEQSVKKQSISRYYSPTASIQY
jgi:hypothetical protein